MLADGDEDCLNLNLVLVVKKSLAEQHIWVERIELFFLDDCEFFVLYDEAVTRAAFDH